MTRMSLVRVVLRVGRYLGLVPMPTVKILFLGISQAGKSTMIEKLKEGTVVEELPPTERPQDSMARFGDAAMIAKDVGGHREARDTWAAFKQTVDAIIYMIDGTPLPPEHGDADVEFRDSDEELRKIMVDEGLLGTPILILVNKCDRPECLSIEEMVERFSALKIQRDLVAIYRVSAITGEGLEDAFRKLESWTV